MIDIHSHVLYGLDDGAEDLEASLEMLRAAAGSGTTDIVATPHASPEFEFQPEAAAARIAELQRIAPAPRIHRGCEMHLTPENIAKALARPEAYSIDGNGYLLVEFADFFIPDSVDETFARMRAAGVTPVITHPERLEVLQRQIDCLARWTAAGCLVQVTALSLTGGFGRRAKASAEEMLARGLVSFVASDAHDARRRTPVLREAREWLVRNYGQQYADILLEENPRAALAGCRSVPLAPKRRRKWSFF